MNNSSYEQNQRLFSRLRNGKIVRIKQLQEQMLSKVNGYLAELEDERSLDSAWYERTVSQTKELRQFWDDFSSFFQTNYLAKRSDLSAHEQSELFTEVKRIISSESAECLRINSFQLFRTLRGLQHIADAKHRQLIFANLGSFKTSFAGRHVHTWVSLVNYCRSAKEFNNVLKLFTSCRPDSLNSLVESIVHGSYGDFNSNPWFKPAVLQLILDNPDVSVANLSNLFRNASQDEVAGLLERISTIPRLGAQYEAPLIQGLLNNDQLPEPGREAELLALFHQSGVDLKLEAKNADGSTELLQAIEGNDWSAAIRFLKLGAQTNNLNNFGCNARQWVGICHKFAPNTGPSFHSYSAPRSDSALKQDFLLALDKAELMEQLPSASPRRKKVLPRL